MSIAAAPVAATEALLQLPLDLLLLLLLPLQRAELELDLVEAALPRHLVPATALIVLLGGYSVML